MVLVSVLVLFIPLGSIHFFSIYENELIRQTESELIGQAAGLSAVFRRYMALSDSAGAPERPGDIPPTSGSASDETGGAGWVRYVQPVLDLAGDPILPPFPDPLPASGIAREDAARAGLELNPILRDVQQVTLAGIRVLDPNGIVVASSGGGIGLSLAHAEEVAAALAGRFASTFREKESPPFLNDPSSISRGRRIRIQVALPVFDKSGDRVIGAVLLSRTPVDLLQALYRQKELVFFGLLLAVALSVAVGLIISLTISRPLGRLVEQVAALAVRPGERPKPLRRPVTREIDQLSRSFVAMAGSLEQRAEYIRTFALHVSHEFKTPLTAIGGSIELLQTHLDAMSPEQRDRFLANAAQDARRLRRLVERLLELARADVHTPSRDTAEPAPLLRDLAGRYAERGLTVTCADDVGGIRAAMSREVLEMILSNLLDNSLAHGADHVLIRAERSGAMLELDIADNGEGIAATNRERIFTPFFTTRREAGGTGLGLSIVCSLLKAHGGSIRCTDNEQGARFVLTIPLSPAPCNNR